MVIAQPETVIFLPPKEEKSSKILLIVVVAMLSPSLYLNYTYRLYHII